MRRKTRWRIARILLSVGTLAMIGCSRGSSAPVGFEPDRWFGCPDLVGDYRLEEAREVGNWIADPDAAGVEDWFSLSIEPDPIRGGLRMALRRKPETVLKEAMALRETAPETYLRWREQVRFASGTDRGRPGGQYGESILRQLGPAVEVTAGFRTAESCERGWAPAPNPGSNRLFARGVGGELLMQTRLMREVRTGWSFFGTPVTYPRHDRTQWLRLQPLPPATVVRLDPVVLPSVARATPAGAPRRTDSRPATDALFDEVDALLRRSMPRGVNISLLRPTQLDPLALSLAPGAVRIEVAGTFDADSVADPFQEWLQRAPRARDIELRRRESRGDGRDYALVRFTWRARDVQHE